MACACDDRSLADLDAARGRAEPFGRFVRARWRIDVRGREILLCNLLRTRPPIRQAPPGRAQLSRRIRRPGQVGRDLECRIIARPHNRTAPHGCGLPFCHTRNEYFTSGVPSTTDIARTSRTFRAVPTTDSCTAT